MRAGAVLLVGVVALAAGTASIRGAVAASHRAAKPAFWSAESPSWSTDGKQIVFSYVRYVPQPPYGPDPTRYRIVRKPSRPGGAIHTVYAAKSGKKGTVPVEMRWTAGGRILFTLDSSASLLSVSVHGGKPKGLIFPACHPRYSLPQCWPAGFILSPNREIAAVDNSDFVPSVPDALTLAKVNAARPAAIPTPEIGGFGVIFGFSPDGRELVFSSYPFGPPGPWALRIGSQKPVPLAESGIPGAGLVPNDAHQVQWSPDERRVAFVENQSLEVAPTAGGSAPRVLATCPGHDAPPYPDFSWSPTSKVIAFECVSDVNGSGQISTVSPDGTQLIDLLKDRPLVYVQTGAAGGPQWSPDGSRLLFLAHRIGHRSVHVWTLRPNGHDLTRID